MATLDTSPGITLAVIAKAPVAGRAKTRLTPPCTPEQAATVATAALQDTLDAAAASHAARTVLVLDGLVGRWLSAPVEILPQTDGSLAERMAAAFAQLGGPTLMIGADTPQITADRLDAAMEALRPPEVDAVLGPATDGGYWALGLRRPDPAVFAGVPMSAPTTYVTQRQRCRDLGWTVVELEQLRDVDTISDAQAVAAQCPSSRFAQALGALVLPDDRSE